MATYTPNYNLKKPSTSDTIKIADLNGNMDIVDSTMKTLSNDTTDLKSAFKISESEPTIGTDNKYIGTNLSEASNNSFAISTLVSVSANSRIRFKARGYLTALSMITECDSSGNPVKMLAQSTSSSVEIYEYVIDHSGYVKFSWYKSASANITIIPNTVDFNVKLLQKYTNNDAIILTVAESNKFINASGAVTAGNNFAYSTPVHFGSGAEITFKATGYLTSVAMIASCDSNGANIKPVLISESSRTENYKYTTLEDCYLIFSWNTTYGQTTTAYLNSIDGIKAIAEDNRGKIEDLTEDIDDLEDDIAVFDTLKKYAVPSSVTVTSEHEGYFINSSGEVSEGSAFTYSNPVHFVSSSEITFRARGYQTALSMISKCDQNGSNIKPLVISRSTTVEDYKYTTVEDCYLLFSWYVSAGQTTTAICPSIDGMKTVLDNNIAETKRIDSEVNGNIAGAFKNTTFVGDSLTEGAVWNGASYVRDAYIPYPQAFCALSGSTPNVIAHGGYTVSELWTAYNDRIVQKEDQLLILYAGTNGGMTDTMDTDMVGNDYTQWANTNTGCYGKFIAKAQSVGARVVLIKLYAGPSFYTTNNVIDKMAEKFNVPVIDAIELKEDQYHAYPGGSVMNTVHYNDFGYSTFAKILYNRINRLSAEDVMKIIPE